MTRPILSVFLLAPTLGAHAAAPATVLVHEVEVDTTSWRGATQKVTWTVRIEDAEACSAGLLAPAGLDGAMSEGATVFEDVAVFPPGIQAGDTFTLTHTVQMPRGGSSGLLVTATDLPTERARLIMRVPARSPLHVWHDPDGLPQRTPGRDTTIEVTWQDVKPDDPAQAVWSTWRDWTEPGDALVAQVEKHYATKLQLGRELAAANAGMSIGEAADRVYELIALDTGSQATWAEARPAVEVVNGSQGSAVDRGVVLLSLLRVAGYDAYPALYRPVGRGGALPVTVPAPAMLDRPVVVVRREKGLTFIDPAADMVEVPARPASMTGGVVWVPGDLPTPVEDPGLADGVINVNSTVSIDADGVSAWQAVITASGTAPEWLRQLLGPLDDRGREEAVGRLLTQARPSIERFTVDASGIASPGRPLRITVSGRDSGRFEKVGHGLVGSLPPILGPALAGWLPPNLLVRERLSIKPPGTLDVLAATAPQPTFREEATVVRSKQRQNRNLVVGVEIERPYRDRSPSRDTAARELLTAEAAKGFALVLAQAASKDVANAIARSERYTPAERTALGAMLWWSVSDAKHASKVFASAIDDLEADALVEALARYLPPDAEGLGLWQLLDAAAAKAQRLDIRIRVAQAVADAGHGRAAWLMAYDLTSAEPPPPSEIRVLAVLLMQRLQPAERPEGDPEAAAAWRDNDTLLREAEVHAAAAGKAAEAEVLLRRARIELDAGETTQAEVLLEQVLERGPNPTAAVLLAYASARTGVAVADVVARIESAISGAPYDAEVVTVGAETLARLGIDDRALELSLRSARLAADDAQAWSRIVPFALRAGELPIAAHAAERASEIAPGDADLGAQLALMGALIRDEGMAERGRLRAPGYHGPGPHAPLTELMEASPGDALLALLAHHDVETVADPALLAIRAQLRIEKRDLDGAARDGVLLAERHGDPQGHALAFAATVGRTISANAGDALDPYSGDPTTRLTRMEYGLISGAFDPIDDAQALGDDPRAVQVARLASDPAGLAAEVQGWPSGLGQSAWTPPAAYTPNAVLGAVPGVSAWSDPVGATAILRIGGIAGLLPPPLGNLYTAAPQPLVTYDNGGQLLRLDGGIMPLYVAVAIAGGEETLGVGFTPESAARALNVSLQ